MGANSSASASQIVTPTPTPDTNAHSDANPDSHSDTDAHSNSDAFSDTDAHTDSHSDTDAHTDSHSDTDAHTLPTPQPTTPTPGLTPTLSVYDPGGIYNGSAFPATATVAGIGGVAAASLEGVFPTLVYYGYADGFAMPLPGALLCRELPRGGHVCRQRRLHGGHGECLVHDRKGHTHGHLDSAR